VKVCASAVQAYPASTATARHFKKRHSTHQGVEVDEDPEETFPASAAEAISQPAKKRKTQCAKKSEVSVPTRKSTPSLSPFRGFRHMSSGSAACSLLYASAPTFASAFCFCLLPCASCLLPPVSAFFLCLLSLPAASACCCLDGQYSAGFAAFCSRHTFCFVCLSLLSPHRCSAVSKIHIIMRRATRRTTIVLMRSRHSTCIPSLLERARRSLRK
jgi:hypothetical protein